MSASPPSHADDPDQNLPGDAHPRGTLVIMLVFGLFFGAAWLATYFFIFMARGAPQP